MSFSAHNYFLRPTKVSDLPFYRSMMQNPDWLDNSGFSLEDFKRDDQLLRFMSPKDSFGFCGIVIDKINNNEIGFCHFVQVKNNVAECTGGLIKEIHNHGHGISAYACCINDFFLLRPQCHTIQSCIMRSNIRSLKMNLRLGFQLEGIRKYDSRLFDVLCVTREQFYNNNFVNTLFEKRFI